MDATRTRCFGLVVKIQFCTAPANPAPQPRRVTPHERVSGHIPRDHRASRDHCPASDGNWQEGRICAYCATLLQVGFQKLLRILPAARAQIIGEGHTGSHKHVVVQ